MLLGDVTAIGWRAHAALSRTGGDARVLAALAASTYLDAAGEVVWLGPAATSHARAVSILFRGSPRTAGPQPRDVLRLALPLPRAVKVWRPEPGPATAEAAATLRLNASRLAVGTLGTPRGFGAWLAGAPLAFPLERAHGRADALAHACADDDPPRAAQAAVALLGLGPGLTPSGDDFAGGAFFARALLARAGACDTTRWGAAAGVVRAAAARLTHPIGAALLGDLLDGEGWAPLHELAGALARDDAPGALDAARRLTRLGHSSGWDLLAGFLAGARI
ncbi:MAG TPA: DUF2877 domain-containing protein [Methylomirabilota bacterium]|nr:DUF2877 domain-containing protein [Methylomirabilota bacterium]